MKEKKNIEIFNRELLAKYLSNEVSSLEKLEVETWVSQSAENREELEQIRKMLDNIDAFYKAKSFKIEWEEDAKEIRLEKSGKIEEVFD